MDTNISTKRNPSRETCQKTIKRILVTEVLEKGKNEHFRQASDFMPFFQSLYPPSDALTKQVQRAVKAMDMPRDENGYFIVNKTSDQMEQDNEIRGLLKKGNAELLPLEASEPILLKVDAPVADYLIHTLDASISLKGKYDTMIKTSNGILILTREKARVLAYIQNFLSTNSL
ncbi:MAG: hypothetical protein ACI4DO_05585 [Roseburia sp.]